MANTVDLLNFAVAGNTYELDISDNQIPVGQAAVKVWFTVKASYKDAAIVLQKILTTVNVPGTGQITDDGNISHNLQIRVDFSAADTTLLNPYYNTPFVYDIKYKTGTGNLYTSDKGRIMASDAATTATT